MRLPLLVLCVSLFACTASADEAKKEAKPQTDLPIQAKLVANKTTYKMNVDGNKLKQRLEEGKKTNDYPDPPAVDLVLEITPTTNKEAEFWFIGSSVYVELCLEGPGAVTISRPVQLVYYPPTARTLIPGFKYRISFRKLSHGPNGRGYYSYWTEPGEYTLTAKFHTGIKSASKDVKPDEKDFALATLFGQGFAPVTISSDSIKIKVEAK